MISILILKAQQISLMLLVIYVWCAKTSILESKTERLRIGALYFNSATWSPSKRIYRMFTLSVLLIVSAIVVVKLSFCVQSVLLQLVFMANLIYLFAGKPHPSLSAAVPDKMAGLLLLVAVLF